MPSKNEDKNEDKLTRLLEEDTALARANNALLKKLHRNSVIEMWLRALWYAILIGLPFALYFYILEPYFEILGLSSEKFRLTIGELPIFKIFQSMVGSK